MGFGLEMCCDPWHTDGTMREQLIWYYNTAYDKELMIQDINKKKRIFNRYSSIIKRLEESKWSKVVLEEILFPN